MKKHLLKLLLLCCIGMLALGMYACVPSTEQYKVEFMVDGEVYNSYVTDGNSRIVPPSDPSLDGHIFKGWYFDEGKWTKEFHSYSFEKDPIKSDVKIYAYFEYDETHTCKTTWATEVNATCKTEGRKVLKCTVKGCGKVYDTEIIPITNKHSSTTNKVTVVTVPATCVSDGNQCVMEYCKTCGVKIDETNSTINKDINAHDYYTEGKLEYVDGSFCFSTTCGHGCGYQVALSDVKVTEKIVTPATCESAGSKKYVASLFGIEFSTVEEVIPALGHELCGLAIDFNKVYSELEYSNLFAKIDLIANTANCGEEVYGVFQCENCDEYHEIKVNKPHVGTWADIKDATCYAPGEQKLAECSACGETNIIRKTLQLTDHTESDSKKLMSFDGCKTFDVVIPCTNEANGCTYYRVILEDVQVTSKEIISQDCKIPDVIRYTYKPLDNNAKTLTYDEIIGEGCFLGDDRASVHQHKDGWFNYHLADPEIGLIKLFDNEPLRCDTTTNGMFRCKSCGGDNLVSVYRPHTGDWTTIEPATCEKAGSAIFDCDYCEYTETKVIDILEHTYVYELETKKLDGSNVARFVLIGKCVCGKENEIRNIGVSVASSVASTCTEKGEIVYKCEYKGVTYTYTEEIPMISHSLDGVPTAEGTRLDYSGYVLNGKVVIDFNNSYSLKCVLDAKDSSNDVNATYVCSECSASVKVKVYRVHNLSEVVEYGSSSSPCVVVGTKHNECLYGNCDYVSASVAFEEVNHVLEAVQINNGDGTYTLNVSCSVDGCSYAVTYGNLTEINVKVKVVADCCTDGIVTYSFDHNGETKSIECNIGKGNHVIGGVDYKLLLVDGKLPEGTTEIIFVGTKTYFKCEECDQLVEVEVK